VTADNDRTAVTFGQLARRDRVHPLMLGASWFARVVSPRQAGGSGNFVRPLHHRLLRPNHG
jgi:hypothetical protein